MILLLLLVVIIFTPCFSDSKASAVLLASMVDITYAIGWGLARLRCVILASDEGQFIFMTVCLLTF
jgi:hypothetical protein